MLTAGTLTVKASRDKLWESLWDSATLPAWIPGCTRATWREGSRIDAEVEQTLAHLKVGFRFELTAIERDEEAKRVRFVGTGTGPKISSDVEVDLVFSLAEAGDGLETEVNYSTEWQITGRLAKIGQFILNTKIRDLRKALCASLENIVQPVASQ